MILALQFLFYAFLGIFKIKRLKKYFLFCLLCIPYSNAFQQYFYFLGVYVFFVFIITELINSRFLKKPSSNSVLKFFFFFFFFLCLYILNSVDINYKIFLKDIFFILLLISLRFWNDSFFLKSFSSIGLTRIIKAAIFINLFFALFFLYSGILSSVFDDPFYASQYRFTTLFLYLLPFIIYYRKLLELNYIYICIIYAISFIAGSRINFLLVILFHFLSAKSNFKYLFLITSGIGLIYLVEFYDNVRILEILDFELLLADLTTRFEPFLNIFNDFTLTEHLFGKGPGYGIYIKWFEYRGLDPYNAYLDSLYLTFYLKYGLLSIAIILILLKEISGYLANKNHFRIFVLWFLIISFTNAITYSFIIFGVLLLNKIILNVSVYDIKILKPNSKG
jgi:hypothetical protein